MKRVTRKHAIKVASGYKFDPNDLVFDTYAKILKLSFFCFIASMLCAVAGIAGGMIYAPLFLSYNMIPQAMSATQSMLSMTECYAVFMQFEELNEVNV